MCPAQLRAGVLMPDRDPALFSRENTASRASYDFPFLRISSGYEIMIHDNKNTYIHIRLHICRGHYLLQFSDILYYYVFIIMSRN